MKDPSQGIAEARPRFQVRAACVACGGGDLVSVWRGPFAAEPVRAWMGRFHYAVDPVRALGDEQFDLVECRACRQRFHRRILDDEGLRELYGRWIDSTQIEEMERSLGVSAAGKRFDGAAQQVRHLLRIRKLVGAGNGRAVRLLDFGCGDGDFVLLASLFGFEACGIDFSATRTSRAAAAGLTIVSRLENLDAASPGTFDAATLFEVLEHVADPLGILRDLAARLRPGAVLLVESPDCSGITVPRSFEEFRAVQPLEHVNAFTPGTLAAACRRAGFLPVPRPVAHATTSASSAWKTELSRFVPRRSTSAYFVRSG